MVTDRPPHRQGAATWRPHLKALGISSFVVILMASAVGCSSDDDGGGASSAAAPPGCAEAASLKDSVATLTEISPVDDGLDALKGATADVKTDLDATVSAVSSELQPSVDEVKSAFDDLESTLGGISDTASLGAAATEIGTELTQLGTALTGLSTAIDQDC
ncbi:MAG: hypothetical protein WBM72_15435 [Actinomycetota bacterium]